MEKVGHCRSGLQEQQQRVMGKWIWTQCPIFFSLGGYYQLNDNIITGDSGLWSSIVGVDQDHRAVHSSQSDTNQQHVHIVLYKYTNSAN